MFIQLYRLVALIVKKQRLLYALISKKIQLLARLLPRRTLAFFLDCIKVLVMDFIDKHLFTWMKLSFLKKFGLHWKCKCGSDAQSRSYFNISAKLLAYTFADWKSDTITCCMILCSFFNTTERLKRFFYCALTHTKSFVFHCYLNYRFCLLHHNIWKNTDNSRFLKLRCIAQ